MYDNYIFIMYMLEQMGQAPSPSGPNILKWKENQLKLMETIILLLKILEV